MLEAIKKLSLDTVAVYQSSTPSVNVQLYSTVMKDTWDQTPDLKEKL